MSENQNDDLGADDGDEGQQQTPAQLRQAANRANQYKAERDARDRTIAFLRAGIDPEDARQSYFVAGYSGELTTEAIRAEAIKAGFMQAEPQGQQTPQEQEQIAQHQQGQQQVREASAGTQPVYDEAGALMALERAYNEGGPRAVLDMAQQYGLQVGPMPATVLPT